MTATSIPAAADETPAAVPPFESRRRADRLALLALAVIATLFFADVLLGLGNFYMRDLTRYYYPTKQILREIVLHGEFPYWNPWFSAGQPIAANPEHEVFYPLTWLILLPSYDFGYRLHILVHVYIALYGMYALLRSMRLRPFPCFYGALTFGLGGIFLSYINLLPILFTAAWLPLTCLWARRFLITRRARHFAIASLFLGLQFLVGEPTTILQTALILGFYALYRGWYSRPRVSKTVLRLGGLALVGLSGLAVGAAQILPALDHVHDSARSRTFDFDLVSAWSLPWAKFAEFVYPNVLGHIAVNRVMWYWGGGLYKGMGSPFLFSVYVGLLTIALAVGGIFARPRGGRLVLAVVAASSILALGGHTPLLKLLYRAGIATSIRYPEKFILAAVFALIVFAAQMLDRLLRGDEDVREGALGFAVAATIIAATFAVIAFFPIYGRVFSKVWGLTAGAAANRMISLSRMDWVVAALRGAALIAILMTVRSVKRNVWVAATAAFLLLDLLPVVHELNPTMPRKFFDPPPIAQRLPANRSEYRIFHEADWYGQEEIARKWFSTGEAVYWIVRNGMFPMTPVSARTRMVLERDYDKTALLPTIDITDSVWDVKRSGKKDWYAPFCAMSNTWFRGVYNDFETQRKAVHGAMKTAEPIRFVEGPHYPRYYFADQMVTIRDRKDFVDKLIHNQYSAAVAFVQQPSFVPGRGVVRNVHETANTASMDVDCVGQGLLVMSVTPHKYWAIRIDGRGVPAIVTNIAYQSIVVPPGHHRVEMRYQNEMVRVGAAVSATAILLLGLGLFVRFPKISRRVMPAYEETVHVVADPGGVHLEPASEEAAEEAAEADEGE